MGSLGVGVWRFSRHENVRLVGEGLVIAAFVGAGYAISHAIVANVAPDVTATLDGKGP
jgi:hypothetical protein